MSKQLEEYNPETFDVVAIVEEMDDVEFSLCYPSWIYTNQIAKFYHYNCHYYDGVLKENPDWDM